MIYNLSFNKIIHSDNFYKKQVENISAKNLPEMHFLSQKHQ